MEIIKIAADRRRADRRRARSGFRLRERRSGFDRRQEPGAGPARLRYLAFVRRLARSPRAMALLTATLVAVNAADLVLTLAALERGATELNPVMAGLFDVGGGTAVIFKIGVVGVVAAGAWTARRYRRVVEATLVVTALLAAVVAYQLVTSLVL